MRRLPKFNNNHLSHWRISTLVGQPLAPICRGFHAYEPFWSVQGTAAFEPLSDRCNEALWASFRRKYILCMVSHQFYTVGTGGDRDAVALCFLASVSICLLGSWPGKSPACPISFACCRTLGFLCERFDGSSSSFHFTTWGCFYHSEMSQELCSKVL